MKRGLSTDRIDPAKTRLLKERLCPGIWIDENDQAHFSIPELLAVAGLPDTPDNRAIARRSIRETLRLERPDAIVIDQNAEDETMGTE